MKYCKCGLLLLTEREKLFGKCRFCIERNEELERLNRRTDRRIFHYTAAISVVWAAFLYWILGF